MMARMEPEPSEDEDTSPTIVPEEEVQTLIDPYDTMKIVEAERMGLEIPEPTEEEIAEVIDAGELRYPRGNSGFAFLFISLFRLSCNTIENDEGSYRRLVYPQGPKIV